LKKSCEPAFTKTGNSAFFKKQEKDVWHALLSFQGTGSGFDLDALSHQRNLWETILQRPKFQFTVSFVPDQRKSGLP
jgi:hypothetical protein